ncbi:autotransporter assembly complex family protein [Roseibium sp. RKSG952]|uniref:autotransporter assembly complex protein TamA n=1 Tax=Roseibium sp. RKSG952 TaxID=2529384 RepID=UPI001AD94E84|nr:autotransporter assembly complex family protein [Roseibium sp. RKSG952]
MTLTSSPSLAFELFGLRLWGSKEEQTDPVPDPLPYKPELVLATPDKDLQKSLETASLLISEEKQLPSGTDGLIARALSDRERIVATLYTSGYYGGTLSIRLAGTPLEDALESGQVSSQRPLPVTISVDQGPLFRFGKISITGTDADAATAGLQADPVHWGLKPGSPARSSEILSAEKMIITSLRDKGYPTARIADRVIIADHKTKLLDVELKVEAGPKATFGQVSVTGTDRTKPGFVSRQAMLPVGTVYSPEEISKARKRLEDLEIFSSINFIEGDISPVDGIMPITIEVSERKRHTIGAGSTFSSTDGLGLEAYWTRRNLFGRGESLSFDSTVGRIGATSADDMEYSAKVTFEKPGAFGPLTTFTTSLEAAQDSTDSYTSRNVTFEAHLSRKFSDRLTGRAGGELFYANEDDVFGHGVFLLAGLPASATYDSRDDKLNPSKGIYAYLFGEPAYDTLSGNSMMFMESTVSSYLALDRAKRFILAGKVTGGSIIGPEIQEIPASRRFIAGGGGSIRGYTYRNVGPRVDGEIAGGRSLLTMSGELRLQFTKTIGAVAFVDAGNAFEGTLPDFSEGLKVGVGAGLRYFTPVGPLRLDAAIPLEPEEDDPDFAIYVGLSQAF